MFDNNIGTERNRLEIEGRLGSPKTQEPSVTCSAFIHEAMTGYNQMSYTTR